MRSFFNQNKYVLYLLAISFLAYFWTLIFAPVYDFASEFFPTRWFMMNSIENGVWPLWCPYRSMGLPAHADPQSSIFYLPFWLMALLGHYNPYFWGVEFIFHIFMAGWGFYKLAQCFSKQQVVCFIIACCYMMSGPFTGNAQHYSWIIALAWLPWALNYMIRIFETPTLKNALCFALALSLMFTGGYSGFCFILFYFFIVFALTHLIRMFIKKDLVRLKRAFLFLAVSGIALVLFSLPSLISYIETTQYVTRGDGLTFEKATAAAFIPKALLTLFFPWMASFSREWMALDISMRSIFVGLFTLFFLIIGLFQRKNTNVWIFLFWGTLCLLLSFGKQLPLYKLAYHMPFINMLRIQTIFRCFVVVSILVVATKGCEVVYLNFNRYKMFFMAFLISLGVMYLVVMVCHLAKVDFHHLQDCQNSFFWGLQSLFYVILILVVGLLLRRNKQRAQTVLTIGLIVDLVAMTWLCLPYTGYQKDLTNARFAKILATTPHAFPPPHEVTSSEKIKHERDYGTMYQNLGCFEKKIEWASRDPFKLKNHEEMLQPYLEKDELLYLPQAVFFPSEIVHSDVPLKLSVDTAYSSDANMKAHYETDATVEFRTFKPGEAVLHTVTAETRPLVLAQVWYPGWKGTIDNGVPLPIKQLNRAMISVDVPEGDHLIRLYYDRRDCKIAFIVQCSAVLLSIILIVICGNNRSAIRVKRPRRRPC